MSDVQKFGDEFQRVGRDGFDAAVSSFGEVNKGLQAIAAEVTAYSKKAFEDGTRAFEQLLGAKSFEQVIEIQSQYAKNAYDTYIAELSKLGEMYAGLTRNAYKPVEQAAAKAGSPNRLRSATKDLRSALGLFYFLFELLALQNGMPSPHFPYPMLALLRRSWR